MSHCQCHFSLITLQKDTFYIVNLDQEKHICNKTVLFFFLFQCPSFKQAWPLLYSHPWHQYLAFTRPSSLWSSICFLAQVDTCPQVRTHVRMTSLNMWTILWIFTSSHAHIFSSMPVSVVMFCTQVMALFSGTFAVVSLMTGSVVEQLVPTPLEMNSSLSAVAEFEAQRIGVASAVALLSGIIMVWQEKMGSCVTHKT